MEKWTARVSGIDEGTRSVTRAAWPRAVAAIACAAAIVSCTPTGVRDPVNELPFGTVDIPVEGAKVGAFTPVAGWALDDRSIREVRLYIDGHFANSTRLSQPRPDVSQIFPKYAHGRLRHGWSMLAGFDMPGPHTLVVQAVDSDGATRDIGVLNVTAVDK